MYKNDIQNEFKHGKDSFMKHKKADIQRQEYADHPMQENATMNLKLAARNLAPWGFDHEASAVVHYYKKSGTHDYTFIVQLTGIGRIPEAQADVGWKELKKSLMTAYGREDKTRQDVKEELI